MNNFYIYYNALRRAFDKENVLMPAALVEILKLNNAVYSSNTVTTTNNIDSDSDATTNNEESGSDASDDSNNIDSNKIVQGYVNS
jgi:hypothetical protein